MSRSHNPSRASTTGLGWPDFARRYFRDRGCFLFLRVLRCFSSPGLPRACARSSVLRPMGLPHSEILGSQLVCSSPRLIAAYHVLRRLPVPRHPPCALTRLISQCLGVIPQHHNTPLVSFQRTETIERGKCGRLSRPFIPGLTAGATRRSRKEVIQPQVPLRLPCYDFAPVTELTLDGCVLAVRPPVSGPPGFHGVTGGVYKARERIHRGVADPRLLAIPASCSRVADCNPNLARLLAIGSPSRVRDALYRAL